MANTDKSKSADPKFLEVDVKKVGKIDFAFGNGQKLQFDVAKCNADIKHDAMLHGFNQKLRDTTAGFSKEKDYAGAIAALTEVMDTLYSGEWNRKGGGNGGMSFEDLCAAIAEIQTKAGKAGVTVEKVKAALEKAGEEKRKEYQKNQQVVAIVARFRAERAAQAAKGAKVEDLDIDLG